MLMSIVQGLPVLLDTLPQLLIGKTVEALDGLPWYSLLISFIQVRQVVDIPEHPRSGTLPWRNHTEVVPVYLS